MIEVTLYDYCYVKKFGRRQLRIFRLEVLNLAFTRGCWSFKRLYIDNPLGLMFSRRLLLGSLRLSKDEYLDKELRTIKIFYKEKMFIPKEDLLNLLDMVNVVDFIEHDSQIPISPWNIIENLKEKIKKLD